MRKADRSPEQGGETPSKATPSRAPLTPSQRKSVLALIGELGEAHAAERLGVNRYTVLRAALGLAQSRAVRFLLASRLDALARGAAR